MKKIFKNKTILITGGTGFLGTALVREILKYEPKVVRIFSRDEVKHYRSQIEFDGDPRLRNLVGDVRDIERVRTATKECDLVIHAAALKRLDLLEYNVNEAIKTNIVGTMNVIDACMKNKVKKVIFISTDKACFPANTYGACKYVSERAFIESNYSCGHKAPIFSVVRYGNVLQSTGSVIPFFEEKIKKGETIPLTDSRMTRFIITSRQAVQLVFNAIKYGVGGDVFIPKLPAFRIIDLVEILKEKHNARNKVKVIGIRPGEKIHELMVNRTEIERTYSFKDMFVIFSHLENLKDLWLKPVYLKNKPLTEKGMMGYSSEQAVLNKDEVKKLFKKHKVI